MKLLTQKSLETISGGIWVDNRVAYNIPDDVVTIAVMVHGDWAIIDGQKKFVPTPYVYNGLQTLGEILSQA